MEQVIEGAVAQSSEAQMPELAQNSYGVRLNFSNGTKMMFAFDAVSDPVALSGEIAEFLKRRVGLLDLKDEQGKRPFKASDLLPNRKCTIDIVHNGKLLKASLMGVECQPRMIFKNEGKLFQALVGTLLGYAKRDAEREEAALVEMVGTGI